MLAGRQRRRLCATIYALLWVGLSGQASASPLNFATPVTWLQVPVSEAGNDGTEWEPVATHAMGHKLDEFRVLITLPGNQVLRFDASDLDAPGVWLAESPATFREILWHRTNLPQTLIIGDVAPTRRTVLLQFPNPIPADITTRITVGRMGDQSGVDRVFPLPTESVRADGQKYWRLAADQPVALTVPGGVPLDIESRIEMPGHTDTVDYQLTAQWQERPPLTAIFNGHNVITTDAASCSRISSRRQHLQIEPQNDQGQLILTSDRDILIRVASATTGRYLLDINRRPAIPGMQVLQRRAAHTLNLAMDNALDWPRHEQQLYARTLALLDNKTRQGGISALALLDSYLAHTPSQHLDALRNTVWERSTLYRDLQPVNPPAAPVLMRYGAVNLPGQYLTKPEAYFYPLQAPLSFSLQPLPERSFARVALSPLTAPATRAFAEVRVEFDHGDPVALLLDLAANKGAPLPGGVASVFDGALETAAHSIEISLPAGIKTMRIRQLSGPPLIAAAEYRTSKAFTPSEVEFITLLETDRQLLRDVFIDGLRHPARNAAPITSTPAAQDSASATTVDTGNGALVSQYWRPLLRYLEEQRLIFSRELDPRELDPRELGPRESGATRKSTSTATASDSPRDLNSQSKNSQSKFTALTAARDWDGLLAVAHPAAERSAPAQRLDAWRARDLALRQLGEHRTAEHFLKLALTDPDDKLRQFAETTLADLYGELHRNASLVGLYAYLAFQPQGEQYLEKLADTLALIGRARDHLRLLSIASPPAEKIMNAALNASWWRMFERNLRGLTALQQQHWMAMRALHNGDFDAAAAHWRAAVQPEQAAYAVRGKALLDNLYDGRQDAATAWFDWTQKLPGERVWQELPAALVFAKTKYIDNPAHNIRQKVYHTEPGQPIAITVQGPVTLKLMSRGIMTAAEPHRFNDWLRIADGGDVLVSPMQNKITSDRTLDDGSALSMVETVLVHLTEGIHRLNIEPGQHAAVVHIALQHPVLTEGSLPDPQLTALLGSSAPVKANGLRYRWLQQYLSAQECAKPTHPRTIALDPLFHARLFDARPLDARQPFAAYPAPNTRKNAAFGEAQIAEQARPILAVPTLKEWAANPATIAKDQLYQFVLSTLWHQQHQALSDDLSGVLLTVAYRQGAHIPRLAQLYRGAVDQYDWQPITTVRSSAGIRKFSEGSDHYQSAELRRDLLLKGSDDGISHLLGHTRKVALSYNNVQPATLDLRLRQLLLPGKVLPDTRVNISVDGKSSLATLAGSGEQRSLRLNMAPGQHQIHLSLAASHVETQVALSLTETYATHSTQIIRDLQLPYFVASPGAPVTVTVPGPTVLRVDRKIGGRIVSTYRPILAGMQTLTLSAPDNKTSGFYRLYQLRRAPQQGVENHYVYAQPQLADPLLGSSSQPLQWPEQIDGYVLSENQHTPEPVAMAGANATWSATVDAGQLRQSEEDSGQGVTPFFIEQNISYRRFFEDLALYVRTDLLRRNYDGEIDTLVGARQWLDWEPQNSNLSLGVYGHYYTQTVDEPDGNNRNHTAYLSANGTYRTNISPTLYNRVQIQAFQYWLTLDRDDVVALNSVDPDLYSTYKDDHPSGWDFSDRLTFSHWRDNRIYMEGELRSNGLGNPGDVDFSGIAFGVDQLIGDFTIGSDIHRRNYSNDNDRNQDSHSTRLGLYAYWQRWRNKYGLDVRLNSNIDLDNGNTAWMLSGTWYFHNNRFLRDFRPSEISFRNHRESRFSPAGDSSTLTPIP